MTEEQGSAVAGTSDKPLDKMTVKELRDVAKEIPDITGASGMKKDELLAAIKKAQGIEEEPPKKKKKKTGPSTPLTAKELKEKLAAMRQDREQNKDSMDKHGRAIMRRRLNRLKKRARKAATAV